MNDADMVLVRTSFPVTGQPIRVVMIDGEPWFVTADVCKVLGRKNPSDTAAGLPTGLARVVDLRLATLGVTEGMQVSAGQKPYEGRNPMIGVISEAGLYRLVLRSDKPAARPFQDWVTGELLPSIRRGDTDVPQQQRRMAESLAEAIGQRVEVLAEVDRDDHEGVHLRSDGTVHCRHGEMAFVVPGPGEDSGPPFGPYYECRSVERVGIRGGRALVRCGRLKMVDLARRLASPRPPSREPRGSGPLTCELGRARIHGDAAGIAALLRAAGEL
ncbi:BRO family protein [Kitasatospora sp. NPDC048540]|uniref:BRO-N domain-containing protein n=1 Tax=unclassified Kitasatospora TaxID=2633591 RepID=UPI000691399B|nr:BRO family protein [Kitasatospora sp. MBT63]